MCTLVVAMNIQRDLVSNISLANPTVEFLSPTSVRMATTGGWFIQSAQLIALQTRQNRWLEE